MKVHTIQGVLLGVIIGVAVGVGVYTFAYAKGWSYLTDDPAACAENSTGFHAPQEAARILGESVDFSRKGQIALRDGKTKSRSQTAK